MQKLTEPWSAAAGDSQPFHLTGVIWLLITSTPLQLLGMSSFGRLNKNESGLFEEAFSSHEQQGG